MKEDLEGRKVKVSAPGKIILSGEHSVVYGKPEIITAIDLRLRVAARELKNTAKSLIFSSQEPVDLLKFAVKKVFKILGKSPKKGLEIGVDSEIPVGSGLGSSAALAVATTAALFKYFGQTFDKEKINEIAYEIEKKQHGTPSGGDNTIVTYGGFLWFRKEAEGVKLFHQLKPKRSVKLLLIDTGKPKETTGEMVRLVKDFSQKYPKKAKNIFQNIEEVTRCFLKLLIAEKNYSLRDLLKENERLLESLGVVSGQTKEIIRKIEDLGGGAKISGAGGKKAGSGIVLAYHQRPEVLLNFAQKENLSLFKVKLREEGVRVEKEKNGEERNNSS